MFVLAGVHLSSPTRLIPTVSCRLGSLREQADVGNSCSDPTETHWMAPIRHSAFNEPGSDRKLAALVA